MLSLILSAGWCPQHERVADSILRMASGLPCPKCSATNNAIKDKGSKAKGKRNGNDFNQVPASTAYKSKRSPTKASPKTATHTSHLPRTSSSTPNILKEESSFETQQPQSSSSNRQGLSSLNKRRQRSGPSPVLQQSPAARTTPGIPNYGHQAPMSHGGLPSNQSFDSDRSSQTWMGHEGLSINQGFDSNLSSQALMHQGTMNMDPSSGSGPTAFNSLPFTSDQELTTNCCPDNSNYNTYATTNCQESSMSGPCYNSCPPVDTIPCHNAFGVSLPGQANGFVNPNDLHQHPLQISSTSHINSLDDVLFPPDDHNDAFAPEDNGLHHTGPVQHSSGSAQFSYGPVQFPFGRAQYQPGQNI